MAKHIKLKARKREKLGHTAKHVLREGGLPAVVYSKAVESTPISVDYKEFYHTYKETGKTSVIDLDIDGQNTIPCIVYDLDIHPVKDIPRHIDFLAVNLKEKITTPVPVEIEGEAPAVKEFGAVINVIHNEIQVTALPDKLPESIIVNLESLAEMSDTITIQDLAAAATDYEFADELDTVIVTLAQATEEVEEEETTPIEGEEGLEGEGGETGEGTSEETNETK
jgi:large subunit ribosomal protein L25